MKFRYGQTVIVNDNKKFFVNTIGEIIGYQTDGSEVIYLLKIGDKEFKFKEKELSTP